MNWERSGNRVVREFEKGSGKGVGSKCQGRRNESGIVKGKVMRVEKE